MSEEVVGIFKYTKNNNVKLSEAFSEMKTRGEGVTEQSANINFSTTSPKTIPDNTVSIKLSNIFKEE